MIDYSTTMSTSFWYELLLHVHHPIRLLLHFLSVSHLLLLSLCPRLGGPAGPTRRCLLCREGLIQMVLYGF